MPWCEPCAKYYTPNSVEEDDTCPTCGEQIEAPADASSSHPLDDETAPWHFKLLVTLTAVYLGWRLVDWLIV